MGIKFRFADWNRKSKSSKELRAGEMQIPLVVYETESEKTDRLAKDKQDKIDRDRLKTQRDKDFPGVYEVNNIYATAMYSPPYHIGLDWNMRYLEPDAEYEENKTPLIPKGAPIRKVTE